VSELPNKSGKQTSSHADTAVNFPVGTSFSDVMRPDAFSHLEDYKPKRLPIPKGVYRFKTHEEANDWWDKMMARAKTPEE